jgi:hypothetical protein
MSQITTRKGKLQIPIMHVLATVLDSFNIFDTNNHDGLDITIFFTCFGMKYSCLMIQTVKNI